MQSMNYNMKSAVYLLGLAVLLFSCHNEDGEYDATGVFETTEVIVSAQGTGEIMRFDIDEGKTVDAEVELGYIDTVQLSLKKQELLANLEATDSRRYDVARQIASLREEIATQKREQQRYQNLVQAKAANQKQLDDINARLATLEKQLAAQTETLENGNRMVSGQVRMLEAQLAQVEDQIGKCRISSPINGTILSKYAEAGELASQGRALFKVGDIVNMYLRAYITADQLPSRYQFTTR